MKTEPTNSTNNLASLENLVKLTPIFTASILAISIVYDSGYLLALGLTLLDIPSNITEHIRSAILWSPIFILLLMVFGVIYALTDDNANPHTTNKPSKLKKHEFIVLFGSFFILISILLTIGILEKTYLVIFPILALAWFGLIFKLIHSYEKRTKQPSIVIFIMYFLPLILCIFGFSGYFFGKQIINKEKPQWQYLVKREDKEISLDIFGHRRFTEFTIAVIVDRKILIIQNNNIISIKSL